MGLDIDLVDAFTDGTVRWDAGGIRRQSVSRWKSTIVFNEGNETIQIRTFFDDVLTDVTTQVLFPLDTTQTVIRILFNSGVLTTIASDAWAQVTTGVYTADASGTPWNVGTHLIELFLSVQYTNPEVTAQISEESGKVVSYPVETFNVEWVSDKIGLHRNSNGQFVNVPPHQHVGEYDWDTAIGDRGMPG